MWKSSLEPVRIQIRIGLKIFEQLSSTLEHLRLYTNHTCQQKNSKYVLEELTFQTFDTELVWSRKSLTLYTLYSTRKVVKKKSKIHTNTWCARFKYISSFFSFCEQAGKNTLENLHFMLMLGVSPSATAISLSFSKEVPKKKYFSTSTWLPTRANLQTELFVVITIVDHLLRLNRLLFACYCSANKRRN